MTEAVRTCWRNKQAHKTVRKWGYHDLATVSRSASETLVLFPLGLVFFVPLAFADRFAIGFPKVKATSRE